MTTGTGGNGTTMGSKQVETYAKAVGVVLAVALLCAVAPAAEAAFPGKPGRIAYSAQLPGEDESGGNTIDRGSDIFTVNPDGTDRRRITFNGPEPDDDRDPAWSPDGNVLAFASYNPSRPTPLAGSRLFTVSPDGSFRREIPNTDDGFDPLFFPSGQRLYYSTDFFVGRSLSINLDGTGRQSDSAGLNYGPHISPDGRRKVFARGSGMAPDIYVSDLDGSNLERLTATVGGGEVSPVFSPDGSAIAFVGGTWIDISQSIKDPTIVILDLRTRAQTIVSEFGVPSINPDWGAIPVKCEGNATSQVGTSAGDNLTGTGSDVITGLEGDDVIAGGAGEDLLCGDGGGDMLDGGEASDKLLGDVGSDTLIGGADSDQLMGGADRDRLNGGAADDQLAGEQGPDKLKGGAGRDRLVGGPGRDILKGGKGKRDRCIGGKGRDRAIGCEKTKGI